MYNLPCSAPWMLWGRHYTELPGINWNARMMGCIKWKTSMFDYKVTNQRCIKWPGHVKTEKSKLFFKGICARFP